MKHIDGHLPCSPADAESVPMMAGANEGLKRGERSNEL